MSIDETTTGRADEARTAGRRISLDRHGPEYRTEFVDWAQRLHAGPRIAWNDTHGGYWIVNGNQELFDVARRSDVLSNDADIFSKRRGYDGISIPASPKESRGGVVGGFLEMD